MGMDAVLHQSDVHNIMYDPQPVFALTDWAEM